MKRILLAGASLGLLAASASAADLGYRRTQDFSAPVTTALPSFVWTGFYLGANAGYAWGTNKADFPTPFSAKHSGFIGGVQAGYNHQMGQVVLGVETDLNYVQNSLARSFVNGLGATASLNRDNGWLGTTRGRLGFTPVERLLVYGTGGLAYGNSDVSVTATSAAGARWTGKTDSTKVGWTIGAGAEYAFTNNITGKAEFLYYDLGTSNASLAAANAAAAGVTPVTHVENRGQLLRAGVNYKF